MGWSYKSGTIGTGKWSTGYSGWVETLNAGEVREVLDNHPAVKQYAVLDFVGKGHNKVYILIAADIQGTEHLIRFWGRHASRLQFKCEPHDGKLLNEILKEKEKKGYEWVDDDKINEHVRLYKEYFEQAFNFIEGKK